MTLRQSPRERQLRLVRKADMPKAPLEKHLVDAIRQLAHKMGLIQWSGRIAVWGHQPPFLPVFGAGTPDVLGVFRDGRMWGLEAKRGPNSKERESQLVWAAAHPYVLVETVRTVEDAHLFFVEHMQPRPLVKT